MSKLTYVAVDRICKGDHRTAGYWRVVQVFHPQWIVPVLPKVERNPKIKNSLMKQQNSDACLELKETC